MQSSYAELKQNLSDGITQVLLELTGNLMALRSQVLQQRLSTGDAASESLCMAPLRRSALGKAVHADVDGEVAELGILVLHCPLLEGV